MKIKSKKLLKKLSKFTTSREKEELKKQREKRNGVQFEFTPTSTKLWEGKINGE